MAPRRIRFYQVTTPTQPILFRAIPWFSPLSEPIVKTPRRLPEADQQAFVFTGKPPAYFYPLPFLPRPNEPNPTSKPRLPPERNQDYAGRIYPYFYPLPFLPQLSEPVVKSVARLAESSQQAFATVSPPLFNPLPWLPQLSEPIVKSKPLLRAEDQQFYAGPNYAYFYPLPWFSPLSEPVVKTPSRLLTANQQAFSGPTPTIFRDIQWYDPLSEPVRTSPRLPEALHLTVPGFLAQPPPTLITIPWFIPLSEPVAKPSLSAAQHQVFAAPIPTVPVFFQALPWFVPLSEPVVKAKPRLLECRQLAPVAAPIPSLVRWATSTTYASQVNCVITPPFTPINNDILIAVIFAGNAIAAANTTISPPSGWTQLGYDLIVEDGGGFFGRGAVYWKRAQSESGNYTFTVNGGVATQNQGLLYSILGIPANRYPFDGYTQNAGSILATSTTAGGTNSTQSTALSITKTTPYDLVLQAAVSWDGTASSRNQQQFTTWVGSGGTVLYSAAADTSLTGPTTDEVLQTASSSGPWFGWLIALAAGTSSNLGWLHTQNYMRVRTSKRYGALGSSPSPPPPPPPPPQLGFLQPASTPPRKAPALGDEISAVICFPGITDWPIAPWVRVQGKVSNTATVTLTSSVTFGNLAIGLVGWTTTSGTITLNSVTDNAGNTYIITNNVADTTNGEAAAAFILGNITNHPTQFTANFSSAPTTTSIGVTEYFGGLASNDPRDGNTAQFQLTPSPSIYDAISSGSVVTTQPGDLIWGAYAVTNGGSVLPFAGSRFNLRDHNSANIILATEDQRQVNAGTAIATFTDTSSQSAVTFIIAVKPSFFSTRWYQPWVDPVRPRRPHYYSDLAWAGPNFQLTPTAFPMWFSALSEPKRTPARLIEGCQQTHAGNPAPTFLQTLQWLPQLSEPVIKTPRRLPESLQQSLIAQPPAINYDISPWQLIQSNVSFSSSTANLNASFAAVGLANLVVGVVTYDTVSNTVVLNNVTDNGGGTYFIANNVIDSLNNQGTASFILGNIRNAPTTVTANFSGATNCAMIISEYAGGLNVADPRDTNGAQQQQSPGTGLDAISSSLVLTTQTEDLIWGANDNTTGNNLLPFAGTGFNLRQTINNANGVLATEDRVQANSGLTAATFTRSINYATSSLVIAIRPASNIQRFFQPLSEPVIKTPRRLPEALHQTFATFAPPIFFSAIPWFAPLSEPIRTVPRLRESAQLPWAAPNWPAKATTLPWFAPLSEPVRTRPILDPPLNPSFVYPLPTVATNICNVNAVESGDSGNLSVIGFIAPLSVTLSVHETR